MDVPHYPLHMTREQRRAVKERRNQLTSAIKAGAKKMGWRHVGGQVFCRLGGWFVHASAHPLWQSGVLAWLEAKPMAADSLFWQIVGLPENERLPLSFRANGAWTIRVPRSESCLGRDVDSTDVLADEFWKWASDQLSLCETKTIHGLLEEIVELGARRHHFAAAEMCLRLLNDDRIGAFALCTSHAPHDFGGFVAGNRTFFDMSMDWLTATKPGDSWQP